MILPLYKKYNNLKKEHESLKNEFEQYKRESVKMMIHKHDATLGISWDTIDIYVYNYCELID